MKKIISFILTSLLALAFVGCANPIAEAISSGLDKWACGMEKAKYKGDCYYEAGNNDMYMIKKFKDSKSYEDMQLRLALKNYQRACDLGHRNACYKSGLIYRDNNTVQDETKAKANLAKACKMGDFYACNATSPLFKSDTEKKALFKTACNSSKGYQICDEYYARYAVSENEAYLKKKCEENYLRSYCDKVGEFYESKNNLSLAKIYYKKACDWGHSCSNLKRVDPQFAAQEATKEAEQTAQAEKRMAQTLGVSGKCKNDNDRKDCYAYVSADGEFRIFAFGISDTSFHRLLVAYKNGKVVRYALLYIFSQVVRTCEIFKDDGKVLAMSCSENGKPYTMTINRFTGQSTKQWLLN